MSDIYLQITETPTVVTLSAPVVASVMVNTVTVANVVSVNVVTMPAISVQAPSVTTVIGTVTVGNSVTIVSLPAISGTVTVGNSITIGQITSLQGQNLLGSQGVFSTLKIKDSGGSYGEPAGSGINTYNLPVYGTVTVGNSVTIGYLPTISGTVTVGNTTTSSAVFTKICGEVASGGPNETTQIITDSQGMLYSRLAPANNLGADPVIYDPILGSAYINVQQYSGSSVTVGNSLTIGSALPAGTNQIGAVTANNQSLTTGSGSVSGTSAVGTDVLPSTDVNGFAEMMIQFTGSFPTSANAQFQVSNDNSTFVSQAALQVGQTSPQATISALGMYKISLGGARYIRLRVTVQGSTSNYIYSYTLNPRTSFNATQPVHIVSQTSLAAGTNRIGVVTIGAGTVTLGAGTEQIGSVTASISNSVVTFYPLQGTTVSNTNFTSTTASTTLVSAVAGREVLTVFNEGAGNLHISPGATCTTVAYQVRLSAGDYWECPAGQLSLGHVAVFATAGTARVTEVS